MRDEDGINAGGRNFGRFFLAAIPYVLGLAAATWLGIFISVHDFKHQLNQEERAAVYTGAKDRPKSKIAVEIMTPDCVRVTRADLDGASLYLYAENDCARVLTYTAWHWQELSPNGVVIHESYTNGCPIPSQQGDIAECVFDNDNYYRGLPTDDRTDRVRVWAQQNP